jgi:exonuclease III
MITVEYPKFSVCNVYTPNSGQNLERLDWRVNTWDKVGGGRREATS